MNEFETGSFSNPRRFRDEFFDLLALPQVRAALVLAGQRALSVRELESLPMSATDGHPTTLSLSRAHRDRLCRLGLLQGGSSDGYRLTAEEILGLLNEVSRSDESEYWWSLLKHATVRAVLATLLDRSQWSSHLRASCGPDPRVMEALDRLTAAGVIATDKIDGRDRVLLMSRMPLKILVQSELIIYGLLVEAADYSHAVLDAFRQRPRDLASYEPGPHDPRRPPPHPLRALRSVDRNAAVDVRLYSMYAGQIPAANEPSFPAAARLRRQRHSESGLMHPITIERVYLNLPRVDTYVLAGLREQVAFEQAIDWHAMWPVMESAPADPSLSESQLRGRRRAAKLAADPLAGAAQLELPALAWAIPNLDDPPIAWAAWFDEASNTLTVNPNFRELAGLTAEYEEHTGDAGTMWSQHVVARHAYRLVETVLLHEHAGGLRPTGLTHGLTPEALTAAARWKAAERRDLRRELHQYFSTFDGPATQEQESATTGPG
jgi:PAS domain-containing protein